MKKPFIVAFAILACLMFAWATGAGRPYPATAGGVIDPTCTSSNPCIEYDNDGTGPGIRGISVVGNGLSGSTKNKSTSTTNGRAGLMGNDVGTGIFNSGVHGLSVSGIGVSGNSTSGDGVDGNSTSRNGVQGISTSTFASGVYGQGSTSFGVAGRSTSGVGVFGQSTSGIAVDGESSGNVGVNAVGGLFDTNNGDFYPALSIVSGTGCSSGCTFVTNDLVDMCHTGTVNPCDQFHAVVTVQSDGTFITQGGIESLDSIQTDGEYIKSGSCVAGCTSSASSTRRVQTYSPRSSQPEIEDNGEAQLVNGSSYVRVDPAFANVIDQRTVYSVSITPEGDSNGLFVTQKTLTGFMVHENHAGRSNLAFEYRIVAKPFGSTARRLPMVDIPLRRAIGSRSWHPGGVVPVR
jgi:hypothetical protein